MDRLELALALPERVAGWHWFHESLATAPDALRGELLAALRQRRPGHGFGAFLAATLLDTYTPDASELARAAQLVQEAGLPFDAGMALLNISFARCLREGHTAEALMRWVRGCGAVDLCEHLGKVLMRDQTCGNAAPAQSLAKARPAGSKPRVAVLCPTLSTGFHAPTTMALAHACVLVEAGHEVAVFSAQESLLPRMTDWLGVPRRMALDDADRSRWPAPKRGTYHVRRPNMGFSMHARSHAVLDAVAEFAPDVVFFIGAHSPLLWPLFAHWPVVGLGTNSVAPLVPMDVWLAPSIEQPVWDGALGAPARTVHTQRLHLPLSAAKVSRAALKLPEQAALWMTGGSRLTTEITPDWCAGVLAALERHPVAHWLIVRSGAALPSCVPTEHPRIHVRPFQTELAAVMRDCVAYLNPPRMGGGQSVALAMAHGLPCLSLVGGDGGDKLGDHASVDLAAYFARLDSWMLDDATRRRAAQAQQARVEQVFSVSHAAPALWAAMEMATERAMQRATKGSLGVLGIRR